MPGKIRLDHPLLRNPYDAEEMTIHYVRKVASRFHNSTAWNIPLDDQFQTAYCALLEYYPTASKIDIPEKRVAYCLLTMIGRLKNARYPSVQARRMREIREVSFTDISGACVGTSDNRILPWGAHLSADTNTTLDWLNTHLAESNETPTIEEQLIEDEKLDLVIAHLSALTPAQAEVLGYCLIDGLSVKEIAALRHTSRQTVDILAKKARHNMRRCLLKEGLISCEGADE